MTASDGSLPDRAIDHHPILHEFKNHLAVVIGFAELLLRDLPEDDPQRGDVLEILRAGRAALGLLPKLSKQVR